MKNYYKLVKFLKDYIHVLSTLQIYKKVKISFNYQASNAWIKC